MLSRIPVTTDTLKGPCEMGMNMWITRHCGGTVLWRGPRCGGKVRAVEGKMARWGSESVAASLVGGGWRHGGPEWLFVVWNRVLSRDAEQCRWRCSENA